MKTSREIRQSFIDFFLQRGHSHVPSSSVVPLDDPTLLFTNAGMNQFKDIFIGTRTPQSPRAANTQKCIRVSGKHNDLEEVGRDTYHHTFFEMLGNWSFGDYFKSEAISWAWELFTEVWGLEKDKLWATVFAGDEKDNLPADVEAEDFWKNNTDIDPNQILRCGKKDNFWEMGDVGPCGPCSEVHIDLGPDRCDMPGVEGHICQVNGDCGRFIELWNLVFVQFNRDESGTLSNLPAQHVDTGAGLERVVAVLQNKKSNYDTDLFMPIIEQIGEVTGKNYTSKLGNDTDNAFRVIADHVRTLTFAIADGALPSNEGRGYILRRILRRAARFGLILDMHEPFLYKIVPALVEEMGDVFPEIVNRTEHVMHVIESEETSFCRTLDRGMDIFEADVEEMKKTDQTQLPGQKAFRLYDTFGFPLDLTELLAEEKGLTVDIKGFDDQMAQQRQRARAAQKNIAYQADTLAEFMPETHDFDKFTTTIVTGKLLGFIHNGQYITQGAIPARERIGLVLDRTCAYAESGGQVGDHGTISCKGITFNFEDTQTIGTATVHFGSTNDSGAMVGMETTVTIDPAREATRRNHTATHLLQWALREVLGEHAHQEGSYVCAEHARFDFTHPRAMTSDEIQQVEKLVRDKIEAALPVTFKVLPIDEAKKLGAMALFSEKYGDHVRVLAIGAGTPDRLEDAFSREFCGGTHCNNTSEIGSFKITREESVATGVRRITAMTGKSLNDLLYQRNDQLEQIAGMFKTIPDDLNARIEALLDENKKLKKQLKKSSGTDLKSAAEALLDNAKTIGDAKVIIGQLPAASVDMIRQQIDWLRKKAPSSVIVIGVVTEDEKVLLLAAVTDDLIKAGVKAGDIVKQIAPIVGGGGGGRPQMAQAGGKKPEKLDDALKLASEFVNEKM
ncbi:MAG: alanine--tRNA ligase [Phycisphaerae bacterium]|nr:alanine--tRNA ligase [Phycisphaerae bacterium]